MISNTFKDDMIKFIEEISESEQGSLTTDTELIGAGIIDSFSIMQVLSFIQDNIGIEVKLEDLILDTIKSVDAMNHAFNMVD